MNENGKLKSENIINLVDYDDNDSDSSFYGTPRSNPIRKRNEPVRYGKLTRLEEDEDGEEPFDDSFSDKNYIATPVSSKKRPKIVATMRPPSKKIKTSDKSTQRMKHVEDINFDDEFDKCFQPFEMLKNEEANILTTESYLSIDKNSVPIEKNDHFEQKSSSDKYLLELSKRTIEIIERISAIEDALLRNAPLGTVKNVVDSTESFKLFMKSNCFPIQSDIDLTSLENKLEDELFKNNTVSSSKIYILNIPILSFSFLIFIKASY